MQIETDASERERAPVTINPDAAYDWRDFEAMGFGSRSTFYRAISPKAKTRGGLPFLRSFRIGGRRKSTGAALLAWRRACEQAELAEEAEGEAT